MVKIQYDFDINMFCNAPFFNPKTRNCDRISKAFIVELLRNSNLIIDYHFIGGGVDSVSFIESNGLSALVIEPANGLMVAFQIIEQLINFEEKRIKNISEFNFVGGVFMTDSIFRNHRNDDEVYIKSLVTNNIDESLIEIAFTYPGSTYKFHCLYLEFVSELLSFGERMMGLFTYLIPEFPTFVLYDRIKQVLTGEHILRKNYSYLIQRDNMQQSFVDKIPRDIY